MLGYLIICSSLVITITGVCYAVCRRRRPGVEDALMKALVAACLSALLVPALPYLWVSAHTRLYASDFVDAPRVWIGTGAEVEYVRVLYVTPWRAKVLFVEEQLSDGTFRPYRRGCYFWFRRNAQGRWQSIEDWDCVWSEGGSADGSTCPPFL